MWGGIMQWERVEVVFVPNQSRCNEREVGCIDGNIYKEYFIILIIFFVVFVFICTLPPILLHYLKSNLKYTRHTHGGTKTNQHPSNDGYDKNND